MKSYSFFICRSLASLELAPFLVDGCRDFIGPVPQSTLDEPMYFLRDKIITL